MGFCFVHAADLHLDSPLRGLSRYEGAPVSEARATRRALENLVQLCSTKTRAFCCWRATSTTVSGATTPRGARARGQTPSVLRITQMARLRETGTRVIWIRQTIDAQSRPTRHLALGEHCIELVPSGPQSSVMEELQDQRCTARASPRPWSRRISARATRSRAWSPQHRPAAHGAERPPGHAPLCAHGGRALAARGYEEPGRSGTCTSGRSCTRNPTSCSWQPAALATCGRRAPRARLRWCGRGRWCDHAPRAPQPRRGALCPARRSRRAGEQHREISAELAKHAFAAALGEAEVGRLLAARVFITASPAQHGDGGDLERTRAQIQSAANDATAATCGSRTCACTASLALDRRASRATRHRPSGGRRSRRSMGDPETAAAVGGRPGAELSKVCPQQPCAARALDIDLRDEAQARSSGHRGQLLLRASWDRHEDRPARPARLGALRRTHAWSSSTNRARCSWCTAHRGRQEQHAAARDRTALRDPGAHQRRPRARDGAKLRIGGTLLDEQGGRHEVLRRAGQQATPSSTRRRSRSRTIRRGALLGASTRPCSGRCSEKLDHRAPSAKRRHLLEGGGHLGEVAVAWHGRRCGCAHDPHSQWQGLAQESRRALFRPRGRTTKPQRKAHRGFSRASNHQAQREAPRSPPAFWDQHVRAEMSGRHAKRGCL